MWKIGVKESARSLESRLSSAQDLGEFFFPDGVLAESVKPKSLVSLSHLGTFRKVINHQSTNMSLQLGDSVAWGSWGNLSVDFILGHNGKGGEGKNFHFLKRLFFFLLLLCI